MANDIDKTSPHYKGEFGSIYEVNQKFPSGGVEGDYVVIDGWAHYWNANRGTWCVNAHRDSYWDELLAGVSNSQKDLREELASKANLSYVNEELSRLTDKFVVIDEKSFTSLEKDKEKFYFVYENE